MAFWGIEVKTGKPFTHRFDYNLGRLHISQATLGTGSSTNRSVLQCNIGDKSPILLCALLPDKNESCLLDLEFEEEDEVIFSVLGPRSVHLTGYYITPPGEVHSHEDDDSDSYGEDIAESDTDQSSDFSAEEDEYDDFIGDDSDDMEMFPPSPRRKSSVVIEEIVDDEKPANENGSSKRLKKNQISDSEGDAGKQIVVKGVAGSEVLESEDEDGFPISPVDKKEADGRSNAESKSEKQVSKESKKKVEEGTSHVKGKKRKIDTIVQDEEADKSKVDEQPRDNSLPSSDVGQQSEGKPKKEKKERSKKKNQGVNEAKPEGSKVDNIVKDKPKEEISNDKKTETADHVADQEQSEGKKKKKKNKKKKSKVQESDETAEKKDGEKKESTEVTPSKKEKVKHSKVRTLANGLIIEDIDMGKPNGKRATPGNKVSVRYIGKLKSTGKIFDSNIARAPFKFRLGAGEVIKGWDFGVNGMQIGDKRRLTIPPSMGYGSKGAGGKIPPNAWLVFDVELLDVR